MSFIVINIFFLILQIIAGSASAQCSKNWFDCGNGRCISIVWICDGDDDCGNLKDELNCENPSCLSGQFKCTSGTLFCILERWHCDGEKDCDDGSDEINCSDLCENAMCSQNCRGTSEGPQCYCNDGYVLDTRDNKTCSDIDECQQEGLCIHECKNIPGSYECSCKVGYELINGTCKDEGNPCENVECSQNCRATSEGPQCYCNDGYILDSRDNKTCSDIDECQQEGFCSHECKNIPGSYECSCKSGYELVNGTCKAKGADPLLVFATVNYIRAMNLQKQEQFQIRRAVTSATSLNVDPKNKRVYWIEISNKSSIYSSKTDGSDFRTILSDGLIKPEGIAVDYVANNLYITDSGLKQVLVCKIDGSMCSILHDKNIGKPRSIALDINEGIVYWSDWGEHTPGIYRSGMDGSHRTSLVSSRIAWPNGIAIDHSTDRLYWADAFLHKIEYISLNGNSRKVIYFEPVFHPYSLAVFEDTLYWTDWSAFSLKSCNKFTGHNVKVLDRENNVPIMGVHIYHPLMTATVSNPCWSNECSHMCLISPVSGFRCACPFGFQLEEDGKTCKSDPCENAMCSQNCRGTSEGPQCYCNDGYILDTRDNKTCSDIDECQQEGLCIHECKNIPGSYECLCKVGYKLINGACKDEGGKCTENDFQCKNGRCILKSWRCDGQNDCVDNSDEENCLPNNCHKNMYQCKDGTCLYDFEECDGHTDCIGGEDELNCTQSVCQPEDILCPSSVRCIPKKWICDGDDDCLDGSDEKNCDWYRKMQKPEPAPVTDSTCDKFVCYLTNECLPWDKVCDGHPDCYFSSDEGQLCSKACVNNGGCSQICRKTPHDSKCFCFEGYRLLPDNKTCVDINECEVPGTCSHFCHNTEGAFECTCAQGYVLQDHKLCKAIGFSTLMYQLGNQIRGIDLYSNKTHTIVNTTDVDMQGMDYDALSEVFFWTDKYTESINQYSAITGERNSAVRSSLIPTDIRYDWITGNLYIKNASSSIVVCTKDVRYCKTLIKSRNPLIQSIDIAPSSGLMFWTIWTNQYQFSGFIERSGMDGSHRLPIVTQTRVPSAIAVDHILKKIYWTDARWNRLECADFHGLQRRSVVQSGMYHPIAVAVFEDNVYWSDNGNKSIIKCNKFTGQDCAKVADTNMSARALLIVHKSMQPQDINECLNANCTQLCLLKPSGSVCACDDMDEATCNDESERLMPMSVNNCPRDYCHGIGECIIKDGQYFCK